MECKAAIDAGICGFHTHIKTVSNDGQNVTFEIQSGCEKIKELASKLAAKGDIDAYQEISPASESVIMATVRDTLKGCCSGCAVPVGLFKSMQVAGGLALPKNVEIKISKE